MKFSEKIVNNNWMIYGERWWLKVTIEKLRNKVCFGEKTKNKKIFWVAKLIESFFNRTMLL